MLRIVMVFILFISLSTGVEAFYLGGIQVNEPDNGKWVEALKKEGMNTIAVTTYAYQGDWDSDQLTFQKENPGLIHEIRAAKAEGLHVVLVLRVALDHAYPKNKFLWHGLIMPKSDETLDRWFEKYTTFVFHWAGVARQEKVDLLGVASEMNSLTSTLRVDEIPKLQDWYLDRMKQEKMKGRLLDHSAVINERHLWVRGHKSYESFGTFLDDKQQAHQEWARQTAFFDDPDPVARINDRHRKLEGMWRKLIADVRRIYRGSLTYAANFDQYQQVGFWDALDVMGINAYFPLRKDLLKANEAHRLERTLKEGWKSVFDTIDAFHLSQQLKDMPIVFTEMGYTRRKNCTIEPWADSGFSLIGSSPDKTFIVWQDQPEDPEERATAVWALFRETRNRYRNPLVGILYWKLSTIPSHRDVEPFVCLLGQDPKDPLLQSLQLFKEK